MKQFFKFMFASMLGFGLTIFLVVILLIGSISALVAGAEDKEAPKIAENTVLHIQFENAINAQKALN